MIKVRLKPGERAESAMRRLRKFCEKEGLVKELRKHEFYEKPSDQRRREARKRKKLARESNENYVAPVRKKKKERTHESLGTRAEY